MKIYIITNDDYCDYGNVHILGVYSTKEKALESVPYFKGKDTDICEFEVDSDINRIEG